MYYPKSYYSNNLPIVVFVKCDILVPEQLGWMQFFTLVIFNQILTNFHCWDLIMSRYKISQFDWKSLAVFSLFIFNTVLKFSELFCRSEKFSPSTPFWNFIQYIMHMTIMVAGWYNLIPSLYQIRIYHHVDLLCVSDKVCFTGRAGHPHGREICIRGKYHHILSFNDRMK